jgi:hypothetical protein
MTIEAAATMCLGSIATGLMVMLLAINISRIASWAIGSIELFRSGD